MKESVRAGRHGAFLDNLARDIRQAFRLFGTQRTFAAAIVGTLALGIGANVALFGVVNSVLLRPLPYHEPDRLVRLAFTDQANNLTRVGFSYSRFLEVQQRQKVFNDVALSIDHAFTLTGRGDPEQVIGLHASAPLLPTLGLQPIIGRNFSLDEDRRGGPARLPRAVGHVAARGRGRLVLPGPTRDADRSGDCAADRVISIRAHLGVRRRFQRPKVAADDAAHEGPSYAHESG